MAEHTWTPEEQKAHRKLWVEALRSGKYQQTRRALRDGFGGYCCLGVACKISGLGDFDGSSFILRDGGRHDETLPPAVMRWLGLRTSVGEYAGGAELVVDNDDLDKTFSDIADIIEAEPVGLLAKAGA